MEKELSKKSSPVFKQTPRLAPCIGMYLGMILGTLIGNYMGFVIPIMIVGVFAGREIGKLF